LAHGLDPLVDDSMLDPDGDGATNLTEFLIGSDPQVYNPPPQTSCSAPAYSNYQPMAVNFTADDPLTVVSLYASFNNGPYNDTGLKKTGSSGSFNYSFPSGQGSYRFYTIGILYTYFQEGVPSQLIEDEIGREVTEVRISPDQDEALIARLAEFSCGHERAGDTLFFYCRDGQNLRRKVTELDLPNTVHRPATLEDVFLKLTGRSLIE
jgi:hypothetical protein